jgi:hypothetical protein
MWSSSANALVAPMLARTIKVNAANAPPVVCVFIMFISSF